MVCNIVIKYTIGQQGASCGFQRLNSWSSFGGVGALAEKRDRGFYRMNLHISMASMDDNSRTSKTCHYLIELFYRAKLFRCTGILTEVWEAILKSLELLLLASIWKVIYG